MQLQAWQHFTDLIYILYRPQSMNATLVLQIAIANLKLIQQIKSLDFMLREFGLLRTQHMAPIMPFVLDIFLSTCNCKELCSAGRCTVD